MIIPPGEPSRREGVPERSDDDEQSDLVNARILTVVEKEEPKLIDTDDNVCPQER